MWETPQVEPRHVGAEALDLDDDMAMDAAPEPEIERKDRAQEWWRLNQVWEFPGSFMISQYIHNMYIYIYVCIIYICIYICIIYICIYICIIYIYILYYILHDSDWLNYSKSIGIGENFNTLWQTLHFLLHHKTEWKCVRCLSPSSVAEDPDSKHLGIINYYDQCGFSIIIYSYLLRSTIVDYYMDISHGPQPLVYFQCAGLLDRPVLKVLTRQGMANANSLQNVSQCVGWIAMFGG